MEVYLAHSSGGLRVLEHSAGIHQRLVRAYSCVCIIMQWGLCVGRQSKCAS